MKDIFGQETEVKPKKKVWNQRAIDGHKKILQIYGVLEGKTCKSCPHLIAHRYSNTIYKCSEMSSGAMSTDWRVGWQACGKHNIQNND